jgi:hypothetical protein
MRVWLIPYRLFDNQLLTEPVLKPGPYSALNWKTCCTTLLRHTKPRTYEWAPGRCKCSHVTMKNRTTGLIGGVPRNPRRLSLDLQAPIS